MLQDSKMFQLVLHLPLKKKKKKVFAHGEHDQMTTYTCLCGLFLKMDLRGNDKPVLSALSIAKRSPQDLHGSAAHDNSGMPFAAEKVDFHYLE